MVIGIIAQLVSGCFFVVFLTVVIPRAWIDIRKRGNRPILLAMTAIVFSTTMMILRGFYRSVELLQGWNGFLITHEGYLIGLDATPMLIAMGILAVLNPGMLFAKVRKSREGGKNGIDGLDERNDGDLNGKSEAGTV